MEKTVVLVGFLKHPAPSASWHSIQLASSILQTKGDARDHPTFQSGLRTPFALCYCTKQGQVSPCSVLAYNLSDTGAIVPECGCCFSMRKRQLLTIHNQGLGCRSSSPRETLFIIFSSTQQLTNAPALYKKKKKLIKDLIVICTFQILKQIVGLKKKHSHFSRTLSVWTGRLATPHSENWRLHWWFDATTGFWRAFESSEKD